MLNWTCFFGLPLARARALPCHALLLDSWVLACCLKSPIWRHSHSHGGPDLGQLEDDDEECLCILVRGFGAALIHFCPLIGNITSAIQIILLKSLLLAVWWPPILMVPQRVSEFVKLSNLRSIFYYLKVSSNLVLPIGRP